MLYPLSKLWKDFLQALMFYGAMWLAGAAVLAAIRIFCGG